MTESVPNSAGFLRGVSTIFVATVISNGLLFAVSLLAARWLAPADYGVVATMLSLIIVLTIPAFALQVIVAREVAASSDDRASGSIRLRGRQALYFGVIASVIACVLVPLLYRSFQLTSVWPLLFTIAAAVPLLLGMVFRGGLQGRRNYRALGFSLVVEGAVRFIVALAALALGAGATGVTLAPVIAALAVAVVSWYPLRPLLAGADRAVSLPSFPPDMWTTLAYFAGFALLVSADLLVVKAALPPALAGEYAAAAFVGKIVLFLPVAVTTVMIPEVGTRHARGEPTRRLLVQALGLTGGSCATLVAACAIAPGVVAALTFGPGYDDALDLLLPYSVATLIFALVSVQALYGLTIGVRIGAWACLVGAVVQPFAMWAVRSGPSPFPWVEDPRRAVIGVMIIVGTAIFAISAAAVWPRTGPSRSVRAA